MPRTRILVLGIDAASPRLLQNWSDSGILPNLGALRRRGRTGALSGIDGFFVGSTWPSIHTGVTPARHGFHYLAQLDPGSYDFYAPAERGLFDCAPFWRVLSDAGRRVAILDAPLSPIEPSLEGMQIVEWGGHDAVFGLQTYPIELGDTIRSRFGDHPVGAACDAPRRTAADYGSFVEALVRGVETRSSMTRCFLREGRWDLFMQVFSEAHCAGHQCWHLHDGLHPAHDAAVAAEVGDPLQRVYQAIDAAIGEIVDDAGDCVTFVFASHGMSHWYGAQFLLPEILIRLGVAQRLQPATASGDAAPSLTAAATRVWHRLPEAIRGRLRGMRERYGPSASGRAAAPSPGVDFRRSLCFPHPNGLAFGGIRLNLVGREPHGTLAPGEQADAFCRALADDLTSLVDERSGRPLIRRVLRVAEHYAGPRIADLPDLLVDYDDALATGSTLLANGAESTVRIRSPKIGVIEGANTYGRSGEHRPQGLLVVAGPGVRGPAFGRPLSILDLAPTWTRLLGVDPGSVDGTPIEDLPRVPFDPGHRPRAG